MTRQIEEGIEILKSKADIIMNAKGEWNGSKLPRLLVERGNRVEEDEEDPSARMWQEDSRNYWNIQCSQKRKGDSDDNERDDRQKVEEEESREENKSEELSSRNPKKKRRLGVSEVIGIKITKYFIDDFDTFFQYNLHMCYFE